MSNFLELTGKLSRLLGYFSLPVSFSTSVFVSLEHKITIIWGYVCFNGRLPRFYWFLLLVISQFNAESLRTASDNKEVTHKILWCRICWRHRIHGTRYYIVSWQQNWVTKQQKRFVIFHPEGQVILRRNFASETFLGCIHFSPKLNFL